MMKTTFSISSHTLCPSIHLVKFLSSGKLRVSHDNRDLLALQRQSEVFPSVSHLPTTHVCLIDNTCLDGRRNFSGSAPPECLSHLASIRHGCFKSILDLYRTTVLPLLSLLSYKQVFDDTTQLTRLISSYPKGVPAEYVRERNVLNKQKFSLACGSVKSCKRPSSGHLSHSTYHSDSAW